MYDYVAETLNSIYQQECEPCYVIDEKGQDAIIKFHRNEGLLSFKNPILTMTDRNVMVELTRVALLTTEMAPDFEFQEWWTAHRKKPLVGGSGLRGL